MLGVLAGRNPLVVSFATSLREGRSRTARTVTMIHASTIGNLKRTVNRPRLVKKLLKSISPGDFHDLMRSACRGDVYATSATKEAAV
jgi:hypothetical protein